MALESLQYLGAFAFGLSEESGASGFLDELGSDWIRHAYEKTMIRIELEPFLVVKKRPLSKLRLGELNLQLFLNSKNFLILRD